MVPFRYRHRKSLNVFRFPSHIHNCIVSSLRLYSILNIFSTFFSFVLSKLSILFLIKLLTISIGQLHALLRFHTRPINLVVFKGSLDITIRDI